MIGEKTIQKIEDLIAEMLGDKAVKFIQDKIVESPNGENEEVIADERQMLLVLASMLPKQEQKAQ